MTYREKIQQMVEQINKLYNDANWLRDMAMDDEKDYWNKHRGIFYDAAKPLMQLDNMLTDRSATRCVHDKTKRETRTVQCNNCSTDVVSTCDICTDCKKVFPHDEYCDHCG